MIKYHEYVRSMQDKPEFSMLIGPEELLGESVIFGGHGGVAGGANINPRLFVDMYNAACEGELEKMKKLQDEIFKLRRLYSCGKYSSTFIKGVKCALNCMGICNDFMAEPFHAFRESERAEIKTLLDDMKLID
jgi:4-hydroxy-tetrahydrodipicolinate synthase